MDLKELKKIKEVEVSKLPEAISNQLCGIDEIKEKVKQARNKASDAKNKADELQKLGKLGFGKKAAIEDLQETSRMLAEAQEQSVMAQEFFFDYQVKLAKASKFLFELGINNIANIEVVIKKLQECMDAGSVDDLDKLKQNEINNVIDRLLQQESIQKKQEKMWDAIDALDVEVAGQIQLNKEQDEEIAAQAEKDKEHDRLLAEGVKKDQEQDKEIAAQAETDKKHDRLLAEGVKKDQEQDKKIAAQAETDKKHDRLLAEGVKKDQEQDKKIAAQAEKNKKYDRLLAEGVKKDQEQDKEIAARAEKDKEHDRLLAQGEIKDAEQDKKLAAQAEKTIEHDNLFAEQKRINEESSARFNEIIGSIEEINEAITSCENIESTYLKKLDNNEKKIEELKQQLEELKDQKAWKNRNNVSLVMSIIALLVAIFQYFM